jgi:hypothetical protein
LSRNKKIVNFCRTHEQIKFVKKNLLALCTGLYCRWERSWKLARRFCRFVRGVGTGAQGARAPPPPNFFQRIKSAIFVQANVAVNTKLASKVPFLFGNFDVFKKNLFKNVQFRYGMTGKFFFHHKAREKPTFS